MSTSISAVEREGRAYPVVRAISELSAQHMGLTEVHVPQIMLRIFEHARETLTRFDSSQSALDPSQSQSFPQGVRIGTPNGRKEH